MKFKIKYFNNWSLILYIILSLFSILPFLNTQFFEFHDDVQVARVYEMAKSLSGGNFPVRWVEDLGYGFGYPLFNFYSVLPYYIGGVFTLLGVDVLIATKLVFVLGTLGAGFSMYFLVKEFFGKAPALVASLVYLYFPYHAVNIYVRGALAELFAYAFLPVVFLSFFKIHGSKNISKKYILIGSLSVAAVILSHNLTAFMLIIFAGLFTISSLICGENRRKLFFSYTYLFGLAFLLSAFYAIPASIEAKYTNVSSVIGGGSDFRDHFVCLTQFWESQWGFGGSAPGCVDGMSFRLGKINILLVLITGVLTVLNLKKMKDEMFVVIVSWSFLLLSLFLTVPISRIFWTFPFMEFLQFPWRFLNFSALFMSFLIGYLVWHMVKRLRGSFSALFIFLIIISTLLLNIKLFAPEEYLSRDSSFYTNSHYLNWTASKISDEYLPLGFVSPDFPYDTKSYNSIRFNLFFKEELDRNSMKRFSFEENALEKYSNFLSLIGVIILLLAIIGKPKSINRAA